MTTAQKLRGTLLGLAWGDVLGYPIETWKKQNITELYDRHNMLPSEYSSELIAEGIQHLKKPQKIGLHSDDTQQSIVLIHSSLHLDGWSVDRWASYLVAGQNKNAWRGTGNYFRQAVKNMSEGIPPLDCGQPSAGTGGAMRIAPVGALYHNNYDQIQKIVFESTRTTHSDVRGISITYAVAMCCAMLINNHDIDRIRVELPAMTTSFESYLADTANLNIDKTDHIHAVSNTLYSALNTKWGGLDDLRNWFVDQSKVYFEWDKQDSDIKDPSKSYYQWDYDTDGICNHPFAQLGGIHAICMGLWPESSPYELLVDTVRQGGDTDTIGAITGAILGSRFGSDWVPIDKFKDKMIPVYAEAMITGLLPESFDDFVSREALYKSPPVNSVLKK